MTVEGNPWEVEEEPTPEPIQPDPEELEGVEPIEEEDVTPEDPNEETPEEAANVEEPVQKERRYTLAEIAEMRKLLAQEQPSATAPANTALSQWEVRKNELDQEVQALRAEADKLIEEGDDEGAREVEAELGSARREVRKHTKQRVQLEAEETQQQQARRIQEEKTKSLGEWTSYYPKLANLGAAANTALSLAYDSRERSLFESIKSNPGDADKAVLKYLAARGLQPKAGVKGLQSHGVRASGEGAAPTRPAGGKPAPTKGKALSPAQYDYLERTIGINKNYVDAQLAQGEIYEFPEGMK